MNQLQYNKKYKIVLIFLMMTTLAFAQIEIPKISENTVLGGGNNNLQLGLHDNATSTTAQNDIGVSNPVGVAINPNQIFNTGTISQGPTSTGNNSTQGCPLMYTHVDIPFLQSCIQSTARISYCNHGNAVASNVYVDIALDTVLHLDSASVSFSVLGNQVYRFQIGTVIDSTCDGFDLFFTTNCDSSLLNKTHCIEAHIYPDSVCSSVWDDFLVQTNGTCWGDSITFGLQNNGPTITPAQSVQFVIIEDHLLINGTKNILKQGIVSLGNGQVQNISLTNIDPSKNYKIEILDATNQLIASTNVSNCIAQGNATTYSYSPTLLWNGSHLPSLSTGCNINGYAPVSSIGAPSANNNSNAENSSNSNALQNNTINALQTKEAHVVAYPNPFSNYTTIRIEREYELDETTVIFQLYDLTGKIVRTKTVTGQTTFEVQKENLHTGIYLFRIVSPTEIIGSGKLIIE